MLPTGERGPAPEGIVQRLGQVVVARQPAPGLQHPGLQVSNKWGHGTLPVREPIGRRGPVHRPLGLEHLVDAPHGLGSQRRAGDLRQLEHLAPEMRPAGPFCDRPGLVAGQVEVAEPGIGIGLQDPAVGGQVSLRCSAVRSREK
jgi:hypothetical protein